MKKLITFSLLIILSVTGFAQQRLLTKKIIYSVPVTENRVLSSKKTDSVSYNYLVNRRFWWEAMDEFLSRGKDKKLVLKNFRGDTIVWDSMINNLGKELSKVFPKKYSKKDLQQVLENEIRSIKFQEEWTWDMNTGLISKKVTAWCPVIVRDSVSLSGEDLSAKHCFSFDIGWVCPQGTVSSDTIQICRNIQYTMPVYNRTPYHWWDNNLEAEYSIPYFEFIINGAENMLLPSFESPDASEALTKPQIEKRRTQRKMETLVTTDADNNTMESDTTITIQYNSEDVDWLRFGEEIYFDKTTLSFIKSTNYIAPVISVKGPQGDFRGWMPLFYLRKK